MKPNFALGLTSDGITLWQRGRSGWLRVGAVAPDAPQMDAQMRDLAKIAQALAPEGITTKLLVPDEQILFCDLEVSARGRNEQEAEIRAKLAGRTPYPVEELDFDWTINGSQVHVAVVARETLIEAEDFAQGYGFNPISAAAAPSNGRFNREPFFGTTRMARSIVGDPDLIEREPEILRETGVAQLPEPEMVASAAASGTTSEPGDMPAPPGGASSDDSKTKADAAKLDAKPGQTSTEPKSATPAASGPAAAGSAAGNTKSEGTKAKVSTPGASDTGKSTPAEAEPKRATRQAELLAQMTRSRKSETADAGAKPPVGSSGDNPDASGAQKLGDKGGLTDILKSRRKADSSASASDDAAPLTFASRRKPVTSAGASQPSSATSRPASTGKTARKSSAAGGILATASGLAIARRLREKLSAAKIGIGGPETPEKRAEPASAPAAPAAKAAPAAPAKAAETAAAPPSPAPQPKPVAPRKDPLETLRARGASTQDSAEAQRLTIFGARKHAEFEPSGMRRGLLVLSGVGLLLLAVAAWVFFFSATQPSDPEIAALPAEDIVAPESVPAPEPTTTAEDAAPEPVPSDEIEAALGVEDAAQQPPLDAPFPSAMTEADQTGPSESAPVSPSDAPAGRVAGLRSVALLAPQEAAPLPMAPAAPAPFGSEPLPPTRAELAALAAQAETDAATPADPAPDEVAVQSGLPDGEDALEIAVTEGTPPVAPPTRPAGLTPELEAEAAAAEAAAAAAEAERAAEIEAALAAGDESVLDIPVTTGSPAVVPPPRPAGLAPESEPGTAPQPVPEAAPASPDGDAETQPLLSPDADGASTDADQASLTAPPPGGVALTALRPAARPAQIVEAALAPEPETFDASELAIAASLRPGTRPSQFSAIVQRALRASQPSESAPAATATAAATAPAPVQTASAAVAAPAIPTSASVAREATQARAINLRQVNLIGVMGTSNSRRALVRLSNGRIVTVRVGESLDGGQVTAIGEDELRYTRRGRNVVLRIAS